MRCRNSHGCGCTYNVRVDPDATISTPLTFRSFVRSFVRLHARTIQSSGSTGRLQVRVHHSMMMMMMVVIT